MNEDTQSTLEQTAQGDTNAGEAEATLAETPADSQGVVVEAPEPTVSSWMDSLPDDLKASESLKGFKDVGELAKAYTEALTKVHEPPESPDAYEFDVPEGHEVNQEFVKAMRHIAHESGISKPQMKGMAERFMALESMVLKQKQKDTSAAWDALKLSMVDEFDANVALAEKAAKHFAGADFAKEIKDHKVHPRAVEVWSKIGKAISEDTFIDGEAKDAAKASVQRTRDGQPVLKFF